MVEENRLEVDRKVASEILESGCWSGRGEKQRLFSVFCNSERKRELRVKSRTCPWGRQSLPERGITGIPEGTICSVESQPWYIQFRKHVLSTN